MRYFMQSTGTETRYKARDRTGGVEGRGDHIIVLASSIMELASYMCFLWNMDLQSLYATFLASDVYIYILSQKLEISITFCLIAHLNMYVYLL